MTQTAARRTSRNAPAPGRRLGKDVADLLVELSVAVHRYTMYPANHPTLAPAADALLTRLAKLLEDEPQLTLGVAHRHLVINGHTTDGTHPILSDLAGRLHAHHIGAIRFTLDLTRPALEALLGVLAQGDEDPIGLRGADRIPSWPGVTLFPIGYQDLALDDAGNPTADDQVMQLWLGLAAAAMAGETLRSETERTGIPKPSQVAAHLRGERAPAYDEAIVGYLLQIADRLAESGESADPVRERIRELVAELDRPTLQRILQMGGDAQRRRHIVRQAFRGLGGTASLKLLEAAASTSGQEIPVLLMRMLTKLSVHADKGAQTVRPLVTHAVRESVDQLLDAWIPDHANPEGYVRILDEFSRTSPALRPSGRGSTFKRTALPVVQMAIEVDAYGDMVEQAVDELLTKGGLELIAPLVEGGTKTAAAERIRQRLASPERIDALADVDQISDEALERLVAMVGAEQAVAPLLRLLSESSSRSLRRSVFNRLTHMGEHVGRAITPFLEDPRWYVVRNMLELVAALPERPAGLSTLHYASHPDLRVRRAALPLALKEPEARARALTLAIRESDERMVRTGLLELKEELPAGIVPLVVMHCLDDDEQSVSLRLLAIRVLAPSADPQVRDALLKVAGPGRSLFGRPRLGDLAAPEGVLVRAALEALVRGWRNDPHVTPLLKAAEKTRDVEVRSILEGTGSLLGTVGEDAGVHAEPEMDL